MRRILLLGYFGAGNFGDDALLVNWLMQNRQRLTESSITADIICGDNAPISGFADSTELAQLIGNLIPKRDALKLNSADYEFLLAPGGSLLQDTTSVKSLAYYLWLIRKFTAANKRVFLLNQGVGPLHSWVAHFFTPRILANTTMLSLRDSQSYYWCKDYSPLTNHSQLAYSADPVLQASFSEGELPPGLESGEYVLFIPRETGDLPSPVDETTEEQALAILVDRAQQISGLKQVLLPLHPTQDTKLCAAIASCCKSAPIVLDPSSMGSNPMTTIWTAIRHAKLVVSHRLHGVIAAAASGVPAMGVAYDPKVQSFCNEAALPYCFPATVHDTQTHDDLRRLWNDREGVKDEMLTQVNEMRTRLDLAQEQFNELW